MVKTIGNVQEDGQVRAVASGVISNGDTIIVNSDGTVSAVSGNDAGAGTPTTISSATALSESQAVYDPDQGKVIVAFHRDANPYYGAAVVGTVSGTSISFGSITKFQADNTQGMQGLAMGYDTNSDKIFIAYGDKNNSTYGTGVVGTVSGTSISFGTPAVFISASVRTCEVSFDTNENKFLLTYFQSTAKSKVVTVSGSSFSSSSEVQFNGGNTGRAPMAFSTSANKHVLIYADNDQLGHCQYIVGTISGSTVSYGTEGDLNNVSTGRMNIAYDASLNKFLAVYTDNASSPAGQGKARVGTLSGTTVTWGSIAVFNSSTTYFPDVATDGNGNFVISFVDNGNSNYPTFMSATVSDTTVSFGDKVVVQEVSGESGAVVGLSLMAYDSANEKYVLPYNNFTNGGILASAVLQLASTNLTSDNFIGFADGAYADTQSAAINSTCSVDDNQTGLTAGQKYYVQTDGTLSTTAGSPTVEAGTAISPTKILVKG